MLPGNEKPNGSIPKHPGGPGAKHPAGAGGKRLGRKAAELRLQYQVSDCRQVLNELEGEAVTYSRAQERLQRMVDKGESDYERKHLNDELMQKKHVRIFVAFCL